MSLDWANEHWVKLYTADNPDWMSLSWDAQALLMQLFRKVNWAGSLELGRHGKRAVALLLGHLAAWDSRISPALEELIADGCVVVEGNRLTIPNFEEAQRTRKSQSQRQREYYGRAKRQKANLSATDADTIQHDADTASRESAKVDEEMRGEEMRGEEMRLKSQKKNCAAPTSSGASASGFQLTHETPKSAKKPNLEDVKAALEAISSGSAGIVVVGDSDDWAAGHIVQVRKALKRFPDLERWKLAGEWLASGGKPYLTDPSIAWVASADLYDAMTLSAVWVKEGKPPVGQPGRLRKPAAVIRPLVSDAEKAAAGIKRP